MLKARIAEWILSLVLPPDRAASTVGDWMEDAAERGSLWFWSCIFRTVAAHIWNDFAESPGFMIGLAFRGWLYSLWLIMGTYFGFFVAICILVPVALFAGFLAQAVYWQPSWGHVPKIIGPAFTLAWLGWCQFQTGRWIARRAPGRELAACIASLLTPVIVGNGLALIVEHYWGPEINRFISTHPGPDGGNSLTTFGAFYYCLDIFLVAGALRVRRKSLPVIAK